MLFAQMLPFGVESPGYVAIRFVQFGGMMTLIGAVAFHATILPRFLRDAVPDASTISGVRRRIETWAVGALRLVTVMQLTRLAAQHVVYFEHDRPSVESVTALVWQSGWGHAWLLSVAACAVGFVAASRIRRAQRCGWPMLGLVAIAMAWAMSLSGHPAAATRVAEVIDVLHLVGVGGWIGGLWMVVIVALPALRQADAAQADPLIATLVAVFSPVALCFAALMGISGVLAAWRNVGTWSALISSAYGQLLLGKVALVSAMAGVGAFNWRRVLPQLGERRATVRLQRSSRVELSLAVIVLVVTAVLVATEMPA